MVMVILSSVVMVGDGTGDVVGVGDATGEFSVLRCRGRREKECEERELRSSGRNFVRDANAAGC